MGSEMCIRDRRESYAIDDICEDACKMVVTSTDRSGPEILTVFEKRGQVLHCVR